MSQTALPEHKNNEETYACPFCDRCFQNEYLLHKHKFTHAPKKRYSCDICDKTFPSNQALLNHQLPLHKNVMHQEPEKMLHTCKDCNKNFVHRGNFLNHRATHAKSKTAECKKSSKIKPHGSNTKFSCDFCKKSLTSEATLKMHYSTHFGKVYSCELCNKTFTKKFHLKKHYFTHTGEKPHKCELCDKGFITREAVKRHLVIHGNESPYKCDWCGKSFKQKCYLRTHAKHWCNVKRKNSETSITMDIEVKPEILSN